MKSVIAATVAAIVLPLGSSSRPQEPVDPARREALATALGVTLTQLSTDAPPSADHLQRVARAGEVDPAQLAAAEYFRGVYTSEGEDAGLRLVRLPAAGPEPVAAALLAVDEEGRFVSAAVVDEGGAPVEAWSAFTGNLRFVDLPRLADARPRSELARVRARAAETDSDEARTTVALLDVLACMHEQAAPFNIPTETNPLSRAEQAVQMAVAYDRVAALSEPLAGLLGEDADGFAELARDSAAISRRLVAEDGRWDRGASRQLFRNCTACHELPLEGGALKEVFAAERGRLGVGDGFFAVGHDIRIAHVDRVALQGLADVARRAALLLDRAE